MKGYKNMINLSKSSMKDETSNQSIILRKDKTMKKVFLKEGYVLLPTLEDWIILDNFSNPADCMYAGVVETRQPLDGQKKYNTKHFVYFCDYKYGCDYPSNFEDGIYAACCEKDPSFKDVLNAVVKPNYEGGVMKNENEYKAAPCPATFHIVEKGDPLYWDLDPDYEPAYGAMIVR